MMRDLKDALKKTELWPEISESLKKSYGLPDKLALVLTVVSFAASWLFAFAAFSELSKWNTYQEQLLRR